VKKQLILGLIIVFVCSITGTVLAADNPFVDVPGNHWAYGALKELAKDGIIDGNTAFHGDKTITRYEMATIVARVMTRYDKADAKDKVLIDNLKNEFADELKNIGVRMDKLEKKVNDIGNVKFNFWGRINMNAYKNPIGTNNTDTQIRYKLKMQSQLADNVWAYSVLGYDQSYSTSASSTDTWMGGVQMQKMYTKVKTGDWYINFGRQSSNEASPSALIGGGMFMACTTGFDGLSTYYVDPKNKNNTFDIGFFNRAYTTSAYSTATKTSAVRNITIASVTYDLFPNVNLVGGYFKDGGRKNVANSQVADIATIGVDTHFGPDKKYRILGEFGKNSKAKQAAASESATSLYTGQNTGWDVLFQYGATNINQQGTWSIGFDLRRFQPGFNPVSGTEWVGGLLTASNVGATSNTDNVKGLGVYYAYVPFKNIQTQLSWYYFAPVNKGSYDGNYRQAVRLLFDFMY